MERSSELIHQEQRISAIDIGASAILGVGYQTLGTYKDHAMRDKRLIFNSFLQPLQALFSGAFIYK